MILAPNFKHSMYHGMNKKIGNRDYLRKRAFTYIHYDPLMMQEKEARR